MKLFVLFCLSLWFFDTLIKRKLAKNGLYLLEFPPIDKKLVAKFTTFDAQLGWVPTPNSRKKDNSGTYTGLPSANEYSIDSYGSRSLTVPFERGFISTYGDSFCLCREVPDDSSFQAFLSQQTRSYVSNYGVGNYGLDQALLRLEMQFLKDPTKHVVMAITPWTIERIVSVWKHYSEPGNVLGAKPRFILYNNTLKLVPNFIRQPSDFLTIKQHKTFLRKNDENYKWFLVSKRKQKTSALWHLATHKSLMDFILKRANYDIARLTKQNIQKIDQKKQEFLQVAKLYIQEQTRLKTIYLAHLFEKQKQLLVHLMGRFVDFAKTHQFIPHLLILPAYDHVTFMKEGKLLYQNNLQWIPKACPTLVITDMYECWKQMSTETFNRLYVDIFGHHSILGNQHIANVLLKKISATSSL
ncbi:MAG: hypothetical protein LBE99_03925 [Puniceicoccales bacterium]|jgi:hypothetical protein|nr:hypothetical protein [Puniceicoccales bacterium]